MPRISSTRALTWKNTSLFYGTKCVGEIVPDEKWPGMWRIRHPNGTLSDMANLSRAKDAAMALATRYPTPE